MDFLYGELNKSIEKQIYTGENTDTTRVDIDNVNGTISVFVNTAKIASTDYVNNAVKDNKGQQGEPGKSAYDIYVENGGKLTETQWLASLAQGAPEYAEDISGCTDMKKLYLLPDGYIYAYFDKPTKTYINVFEADSEYVHLNKRLRYVNAQGSAVTEDVYNADTAPQGVLIVWAGALTTNYIPADLSSFDGNYKMIISGFTGAALDAFHTNAGGPAMLFFDSDKKYIGYRLIYAASGGWAFTDTVVDDENKTLTFSLNTMTSITSTVYNNSITDVLNNTKYIRFNFNPTGLKSNISESDIQNISVSFDANSTTTPVKGWWNTGVPYAPSDYDADIAALKNTVEDHEVRIEKLEKEVGTSDYVIPTYWESEVETAISAIKEKQKTLGQKAFSFALAADMHIDTHQLPNYQYSENIGKIAAKIMAECNIPFMLVVGDNNSGAATIADNPTNIYADVAKQDEILKPVGKENVLKLLGNHDGVWGQTTTDGNTVYYDRAISMNERFDLFMAPQGEDMRRVWGDNGTYFYIDYPQRKARFICLNSQDIIYNVGPDYYSTDVPAKNPMKGNGYSIAQLEWLSDALKVSDGWNIIISVHIPPTTVSGITGCTATNDNILRGLISAYINKDTYTLEDINVDYTSAGGNIVGVFAGHKHYDYIDSATLPCPIIITTTASSSTGTDLDGNKVTRVYGTVNETAFDIVTVDTENKVIYMTRLGGGADRRINY